MSFLSPPDREHTPQSAAGGGEHHRRSGLWRCERRRWRCLGWTRVNNVLGRRQAGLERERAVEVGGRFSSHIALSARCRILPV